MSLEHFSQLERSFLEEESWFQAMRILERCPQLVSEDFSRRLALAAGATADKAEMHFLREASEVLARAVALGVEEAFREKIGEGGLFAGQARETWDLYYESREPRVLGEAIDQFVQALLCNDDPLVFDQGRTLRGFGAALLNLSNMVRDPIISHVGCLAFLGAITAHLAAFTPFEDDSWLEYFVSLVGAIRDHLDLVESFAPETGEGEFHQSVRRACELVDLGLAEAPGGYRQWLEASLPILAVALACSRADLPSPQVTPPRDPQLQQAAEAWRDIVVTWIKRNGSDCFRGLIAAPLPNPFEPEGAGASRGRRFDLLSPDEILAEFEPDEKALFEAPVTLARMILAVLMMVSLSAASAPEKARTRLKMAEFFLDNAMEVPAVDPGSPFHAPTFLATLAAGVGAYLGEGSSEFERFAAIRQAWPACWLEEAVALVEAELSGGPDQADQSSPAVEAAVHAATCIRDPIARLAAISNDLRLPDASSYRRILGRLNDLLFNGSVGANPFLVDEDAPGSANKAELLARFQGDLSSLDEAERDELRDWLGTAYEAGRMSFLDANAELTLLINLGWLWLKSGHEDALKWSARARWLAVEEGALMDAATADINSSSYYLESLRRQPPWSVGLDLAMGRLLALFGGLSHALEALRITTVRLKLADPEDRFHVALGYGEIRVLIEGLLFEAQDASLLTEYLLNARGMWFLLDLYDTASGVVEVERPVVSWRDRSWIAQSLPVDQDIDTNYHGSAAELDIAEILSPAGEPQALWFGNMLAGDSERIASSLLAPPDAFATTFEEYPASLCKSGTMSCLETAEALGSLFPESGWKAAEAAHERGMRSVLFVSPDPSLPPIAMGLWRNPREGPVSVLSDVFDIVYCPTLAPRRGSMPWIEETRPPAPQAFVVCDPLGDLAGARVVPELAHRVCGNADHGVWPPANGDTVSAMIDACSLVDGVFVYQGHSQSGGIDEPGAACLLLEPVGPRGVVAEPLRLRELLAGVRGSSSGRMPRRAAFLSCASGSTAAPYDATGLAMGALAAGSEAVISTLQPIPDSGGWGSTVVDQMVEALRAPQPWTAFAHWQRQTARDLEAIGSEDVCWALSSLTMFGGPYVRGAATVAHDE